MNQNKHISHAIKFGIILGIIRVLLDMSIKYFDANTVIFNLSAIIGLGLEFLIVFLALKIFQQKDPNLTIKDSTKIGIVMLMITGAILFFSINFYHPEYAQNKLIELTKKVQPDQLENILEGIKQAKENPNYISNFATTLVKFIMIGAILGFLNGVIVTFTNSKNN
jgi:hypothetical protein